MFDFDSIVDGSFLHDRSEHKGPFAMKRPQPHAYAFEDDDAELGPTMDHSALAVDLTAVRPTQAIWESARAMPSCPVPAAIPKLPMKKGTTTLGFQFQGGVILAVDSRASMGQYIASSTVQKVLEIDDMLLGTMAGGAADCQYWERVLGQRCRLWELRNGEKITVAAASKILAGITYSMRNNGLSMGTMVAGWDKFGPSLYYVDDQGTRVKHTLFSVGSGSIYAYGVLDSGFRHDLSVEEACDLGRKAIFHATYRDGGSGAFVSVYHIHAKGWTKISRTDQSLLYNTYMAHAALAPPAV